MLTFSAVLTQTRSLHALVDAGQHMHIHDGRLHDPVDRESHEVGQDDLQVATPPELRAVGGRPGNALRLA